jgi:hypothetical protein
VLGGGLDSCHVARAIRVRKDHTYVVARDNSRVFYNEKGVATIKGQTWLFHVQEARQLNTSWTNAKPIYGRSWRLQWRTMAPRQGEAKLPDRTVQLYFVPDLVGGR